MPQLSSVMALKALDGLWMRATVTSQNIANAGTPGYRPLRVTFEDALAAAAPHGSDAVEAVRPKIDPDPSLAAATGVRLDMEMATASLTSARYAALIEVLGRRAQGYQTAMQNG
jgi:flagellar basal-body rod protein FlgB